jgi:hypothetical protein
MVASATSVKELQVPQKKLGPELDWTIKKVHSIQKGQTICVNIAKSLQMCPKVLRMKQLSLRIKKMT